MRILGIDPGYALMGYGVIDHRGNGFKAVEYGSIETDASMDLPDRLKLIYSELMDIIAKTDPDEAAVEELFFNSNAKTAINVGQARGVAILACVNSGLKPSEYTPLQIKMALTGYGRAEKSQVQQMVRLVLGLEKIPKPDDTADALAAAICHAHSFKGNNKLKLSIDAALEKEIRSKGKKRIV